MAKEQNTMKQLGLIAFLCAATACAADDADDEAAGDLGDDSGDETIGEARSELVLSGQAVHTFFASSGNGVVIRVTDTAHAAFIPAFTVRDPAGNTVTSASGAIVAGTAFQAAATGIFSITVRDAANPPAASAIYALYLFIAPGSNQGGALVPGGMRSGHIDEGEIESYTFTAATGEGIALRVADVVGGALAPRLNIYGPSGNLVTWAQATDVAGQAFAAPSTGTYTVAIHDASSGLASSGDYKLYYTRAPGANQGGALSPGGVVLARIDKGELDSYTFTAATGEGIALRVTDVAGGSLGPRLTIYGPAGDLVTWAQGTNVAGQAFAAPSTGTYTVVVDDASSGLASTGDYRLHYIKAPGANQNGPLSPGGVALGHIDMGEMDAYTFTASIGQGIQLRVADVAGGALGPRLTIYGPAGNLVTWAQGTNVAGQAFAAPSTGTYTVVVDDASSGLASTGDYRLYYIKAPGANQGGALSSGVIVLQHIDEGELDSYTFAAATGQSITLRVTDIAGGSFSPGLWVYGPAGNFVSSAQGTTVALKSFAAPSSGTYTLVISDQSSGLASTGDYQLDYTKTP
jgi:hypothetical protein